MEEVLSRALVADADPRAVSRLASASLNTGMLGLVRENHLSVNGAILLAAQPRQLLPQAGLLATIHYPDGTEEPYEFDEAAVLIPDSVIQWLRSKLPDPIDRSDAVRSRPADDFYTMVREAVTNALVHRDYTVEGAKVQVSIYIDRAEVKSPGAPFAPITLEQLQDFSASMLSRNPIIHFVFAKLGLAEESGLGLKSLRELPVKNGWPLPRFTYLAPYLTLTIYRSAEAPFDASVLAQLSAEEREALLAVSLRGPFSRKQYEEVSGAPARTAQNHLRKMTELGLVRMVGGGHTARYEVVSK